MTSKSAPAGGGRGRGQRQGKRAQATAVPGEEKARLGPYDDFVMDHIRNARNFHALEVASRELTGSNPLCGDRMTIQLHVVKKRIEAAAFQCECCGISMASASMMTDWVKGREPGEAGKFAQALVARLAERADGEPGGATEMERALLATVRDFPARAGCAALPWTTLLSLLEDKNT